jgi:hypothetical protein
MTIQWKPDLLCHNPQCLYDQWLVHSSTKKQSNNSQIRTIQNTKIVRSQSESSLENETKCVYINYIMSNVFINSSNLSENSHWSTLSPYSWLKRILTRSKNFQSSDPEHIRIPADPRAPHAFTLNVVARHAKTKTNCLNQVITIWNLEGFKI